MKQQIQRGGNDYPRPPCEWDWNLLRLLGSHEHLGKVSISPLGKTQALNMFLLSLLLLLGSHTAFSLPGPQVSPLFLERQGYGEKKGEISRSEGEPHWLKKVFQMSLDSSLPWNPKLLQGGTWRLDQQGAYRWLPFGSNSGIQDFRIIKVMESAREDFFCSTLKGLTDKELNIVCYSIIVLRGRRRRGDGQVFGGKMRLAQQRVVSCNFRMTVSGGLK